MASKPNGNGSEDSSVPSSIVKMGGGVVTAVAHVSVRFVREEKLTNALAQGLRWLLLCLTMDGLLFILLADLENTYIHVPTISFERRLND